MLRHLPDFLITFLLEEHIPDTQRLVDDQNIRLHRHCNRKCQSYEHPRGIDLHRLVNELPDIGKLQDLRKTSVRLLTAHAHEERIQVNILKSCVLRVKSRAELQQGCDPALRPYASGRRLHDTGQDLQKRGLSGSVQADDPHTLSPADFKADSLQGFEILMVTSACHGEGFPDLVQLPAVQRISLY